MQDSQVMQLYLAALADYQFQVNLTWSRTQYFLTLNSGLISVAAALMGLRSGSGSTLVAAVFAVGLMTSIFAVLALRAGRQYYRPVLDRIRSLEETLDVADEHRLRTTPEQGGADVKLKITYVLTGLFVGIGVIDMLGLIYVLLG